MILDDVFVNYDAGRTRTACSVLREFAKQGHQLLVFTCHEHVWRMFQDIKVDCRRIPNRHGEIEEEVQADPVPGPEPLVAVVETPAPEAIAPEPVAVEPEPVVVKRKIKRHVVEAPVKTPVVVEEFIPPPAPSVLEIEYWWDTPQSRGSNGDGPTREGDGEVDWLPETEIEQHRW